MLQTFNSWVFQSQQGVPFLSLCFGFNKFPFFFFFLSSFFLPMTFGTDLKVNLKQVYTTKNSSVYIRTKYLRY